MCDIHELIPANFFWDISVRLLSWEYWDFWRRHDHFRRFPKKSEVFRGSPKSSEDVRSLPKAKFSLAFHFKNQRSRRRYCHLFILHMVFVDLTWVWVNIFLEIVSSKTATTHIFQSGVRNLSRREIKVFNPQTWELAGIWAQWFLSLISYYFSEIVSCSTSMFSRMQIIVTFLIQGPVVRRPIST